VLTYRVEHPECNHGPYITGECEWDAHLDLADLLCKEHDGDGLCHPSPSGEGIYHGDDALCSLRTKPEIYRWFENFIDLLNEEGYVLSTYDVPDDLALTTPRARQVLWCRDYVTLIERERLVAA
jgi:hypothetical protein